MPRIVYKTADGKRVPSVSSILGQLGWSKDGLIYWANSVGLDGMTLDEARERVTGPGTVAHAMIEADIKGEALDTTKVEQEIRDEAQQSFDNYLAWKAANVVEVLSSEGSLVSEDLRFGGTHDLVYVGRSSKVCMLDAKTGNGVYVDHMVQVAGYGMLWNESEGRGKQRFVDRYEVLRIHKDNAAQSWHSVSAESMGAPMEAFKLARKLYDLQKPIKRLVS